MNKQTFLDMMGTIDHMSLATNVGDQSNVRFVSFAYDPSTPTVIYFTSFPGSPKTVDFEKNPKVSFILFPSMTCHPQVQLRGTGTVSKSERTIREISPFILEKFPQFQGMLDSAGDIMIVYEIACSQVQLSEGMAPPEIITL